MARSYSTFDMQHYVLQGSHRVYGLKFVFHAKMQPSEPWFNNIEAHN